MPYFEEGDIMESVKELKGLAEITPKNKSKIKINFYKYAKKKYKLANSDEIKEFYAKYDQAVKFYRKERIMEKALHLNAATVGGITCFGSGLMCLEQYLCNNTMASVGFMVVSFASFIASVFSFEKMTEKEPKYSSSKQNDFIKKDSLEDQMAQEYCLFQEMVKSKKRK